MKSVFFISFLSFFIVTACKPSADDREKLQANADNYKGVINYKIAKELVENYQGRGFKPNDRVGFNDTRCIWFSLDQLESFVQRTRAEGGDGVRFYLAAYSLDSISDFKILEDYRDHTTLVLVSTKPYGEKKHVDYYKDGSLLSAIPENQGELCPPPSNCIEEGATLLEDSL